MGRLFSKLFKKKQSDEILDLSLLNTTTFEVREEEKVEVKENKIPQSEVTIDYINTNQELLHKNLDKITTEYLKCKIFSRVSLENEEFNSLEEELDKFYNILVDGNSIVDKEILSLDLKSNNELLNQINKKQEDLTFLQEIYKRRFLELNEDYCHTLKMSTVSVCIKMDNNELLEFYTSLNDYLKDKKSLNSAAEEIYYHSSDFITDMINDLIKILNNKYTFSYFVGYEIIKTLEKKEWIDLYNKIKFVYKQIEENDNNLFQEFNKKYKLFEIMYVILMMEEEKAGF